MTRQVDSGKKTLKNKCHRYKNGMKLKVEENK